VTATKIDRLGREHDLHARPETQHVCDDAVTIAATCSALTAPRNVIRALPISTKTSRSPIGVRVELGRAGAERTTTGNSRGPFAARARLGSSDRHQISVLSLTPCFRAIPRASPVATSSATSPSHQSAPCLMRALKRD
jgi:hypothetical protein